MGAAAAAHLSVRFRGGGRRRRRDGRLVPRVGGQEEWDEEKAGAMLPTKERLFQRKFLPYYALQQCFEIHVSLSIMLICNQLRLNFEFWRSSFARMPVGVASKIKRLSSSLPAVHLQHEGGPRCNVADKGKTLPQNKLDLQRISAISLMIFQCLFIFVRCPSLNILI